MPAPAFQHGIAPCPGCQTQLVAPFRAAGRVVKCKGCGTRFALPCADELFESAVAHLLEQEDALDQSPDLNDVAGQIQSDTMVGANEPSVNTDVAWLG